MEVKSKKKPTGSTSKREAPTTEKLEKKFDALAKESKRLVKDAKEANQVVPVNSEARFKDEYARMLRYNSSLIRRLNQQLTGSLTSRDIYALSTLMSQQREVINDLRSITDLSQQVGLIYDKAINPFMGETTQTITDVYYQLRKLLKETTKPKETQFALTQLDDLIKQLGIGIQDSQATMRVAIHELLVGPSDTGKAVKGHKKPRG